MEAISEYDPVTATTPRPDRLEGTYAVCACVVGGRLLPGERRWQCRGCTVCRHMAHNRDALGEREPGQRGRRFALAQADHGLPCGYGRASHRGTDPNTTPPHAHTHTRTPSPPGVPVSCVQISPGSVYPSDIVATVTPPDSDSSPDPSRTPDPAAPTVEKVF